MGGVQGVSRVVVVVGCLSAWLNEQADVGRLE